MNEKYKDALKNRKLKTRDSIKNNLIKYNFEDERGYKYYLNTKSIKDDRTKEFAKFFHGNPYTIENINVWFIENERNIRCLGGNINKNDNKLRFLCPQCSKTFYKIFDHIKYSYLDTCQKCSNLNSHNNLKFKLDYIKRICIKNRIYKIRRRICTKCYSLCYSR